MYIYIIHKIFIMVTRVFIYYFTYQQTYIYCKNLLDCNSESEIVESL